MKKILIFFLLCVYTVQVGFGQRAKPAPKITQKAAKKVEKTERNEEEIDYSTVTTYGLTTNTNSSLIGGFTLRNSRRLDNTLFGKTQFRYMALEVVNVKHPKEFPLQSGNGSRFIPGKLNYLFVLRPQYGREIVLSSRNGDEGIAINAILAVGFSLGIQKPYYVQYQVKPGQVRTEPYDPAKQPLESILGSGGFLQGFDKSTFIPGLHFKAGINFELSAFRRNLTGIEVGFLVETLAQKPIIMSFAENNSSFTSAYLTVYFGSKK